MSEKEYRTLKGFLDGEENEEKTYFSYSATLRIFGNIPSLDEITETLRLEPTNQHRKGEKNGPKSPPFNSDMGHLRLTFMKMNHCTNTSTHFGRC